jgi:DNA-binding response OmpR family regulator
MDKILKVLILEDIPSDAELAQRELKTVLKNYTVKVVDTEESYVQALKLFTPDLIISDYLLPEFNGLSALKIKQDKCPFTSFILLTGSINEETAVKVMKAGADDYVIKEHIIRLGPAVLNAIDKKKIELENKQVEEKLIIRNKELEAWYDVSVNRELNLLDLKKEINELLEKSGEKPKYKIPV